MTDPGQRPIPPPPTGCRTDDDHNWGRTDIVSDWSATTRLFWDACSKCGRQRFVVDGGATILDGD